LCCTAGNPSDNHAILYHVVAGIHTGAARPPAIVNRLQPLAELLPWETIEPNQNTRNAPRAESEQIMPYRFHRRVVAESHWRLVLVFWLAIGAVSTCLAQQARHKPVLTAEPTDRRPGPVMDAATIAAGLASHDRALYIKSGWIRDPYIVLAPDGYYYLTGTTPNPHDPREAADPYNTGLGSESIVGYHMQLWRSNDLIDWEYLGTPFSLLDGYWAKKEPSAFEGDDRTHWHLWAPEVHFFRGKWHIVHTTPAPVRRGSNLAVTQGGRIQGPYQFPLGDLSRGRHDPSLYEDTDGTIYLLWQNTMIAPLKDDLTGLAAEPVRIDPAGSRPGPDGKPISRIGHEGATLRKIGGKYVHFGTAWSTDLGRRGSYNLYYCLSEKITGPYGPRRFAGRFLGHGTPFVDKQGRWWCTAFFNANVPPLTPQEARGKDLGETAQTINEQGVTIVPLVVRVAEDGDVLIRATDPNYASPGPDEVQEF